MEEPSEAELWDSRPTEIVATTACSSEGPCDENACDGECANFDPAGIEDLDDGSVAPSNAGSAYATTCPSGTAGAPSGLGKFVIFSATHANGESTFHELNELAIKAKGLALDAGYAESDIIYMSALPPATSDGVRPDFDAWDFDLSSPRAELDRVFNALSTRMVSGQHLFLYVIGESTNGRLRAGSELIDAADLARNLDKLPSGVAQTVFIDARESHAFGPALAAGGRVMMTSTSNGAHWDAPRSDVYPPIRSSFSGDLLGRLMSGWSIQEAWDIGLGRFGGGETSSQVPRLWDPGGVAGQRDLRAVADLSGAAHRERQTGAPLPCDDPRSSTPQASHSAAGKAIVVAAAPAYNDGLYAISYPAASEVYEYLRSFGLSDGDITWVGVYPPLVGGIPRPDLHDGLDPTPQGLANAVVGVNSEIGSDELFVLYYAGHSAPGRLMIGGRSLNVSATGLGAGLDLLPASVPKVLLVDACNAGSFAPSVAGPDVTFVGSSQANELSWVPSTHDNFTHYFLQGLAAGSFDAAFTSASNSVGTFPQRFHPIMRQTPVLQLPTQ